jgi:hypothetical protein
MNLNQIHIWSCLSKPRADRRISVSQLGSLAWATATGGRIGDEDEAELAAQLADIMGESALEPGTVSIELDDLLPPDSALTRDADALWNDHAPRWLHAHGHRTWYFAAALGRLWGLAPDPELLYCAALLHDLGLTEAFGPTDEQPCFAVSGAAAARPVVARHRPGDADTVAEAIVMHLNLRIDHDGPVHRLVPAGTLVDVTGLRLGLVPSSLVADINARFPRADFGAEVGEALASCAAAHPATRCGWLERTLNVSSLTRRHPLDSTSE